MAGTQDMVVAVVKCRPAGADAGACAWLTCLQVVYARLAGVNGVGSTISWSMGGAA